MQRGRLTKDDVERFEGELGKLIVVKKALELALINPAIKDDQKRAYSLALMQCERTLREFRRRAHRDEGRPGPLGLEESDRTGGLRPSQRHSSRLQPTASRKASESPSAKIGRAEARKIGRQRNKTS